MINDILLKDAGRRSLGRAAQQQERRCVQMHRGRGDELKLQQSESRWEKQIPVTAQLSLCWPRCYNKPVCLSVSGEALQNVSKNLRNSHLGMTLTPESPDGFLVRGFNTERQDFVLLLRGHVVEFGSLKWFGDPVEFVWQNVNESSLLLCSSFDFRCDHMRFTDPHLIDTFLRSISTIEKSNTDWVGGLNYT